MKKSGLTLSILELFFAVAAYGNSVCLRDNTFVAILRKSRDGLSYSTDAPSHKWFVNFDYITSTRNENTIYGFGICSDTPGTTFMSDSSVNLTFTETGIHCWCQMGGPLVSDWVYYGGFSNSDTCASGCLDACGESAQTSAQFRGALYDSVW